MVAAFRALNADICCHGYKWIHYQNLDEATERAHMQQAMARDEILMGRPWTDEDEAKTYFRMKDLEAHLTRNNFKGMTAPKMAQRIRDLGGQPISLFLKNRTTRCWSIPRFNRQDAPFETPEQQKSRSPF